jgi:serine phosphatase RsbU (regulator of sigma subunit)
MIYNWLTQIALRLRPELVDVDEQRRVGGLADIITLLYSIPLVMVGLLWLGLQTDWAGLRQNWLILLSFLVLIGLFSRVTFFMVTEISSGGYANTDGAFDGIILWSAIFLFGPTALWLILIWNLLVTLLDLRQAKSPGVRWNRWRGFFNGIAGELLGVLGGIAIYRMLGGTFPAEALTPQVVAIGMAAILVQFALTFLVGSGYMLVVVWALKNVIGVENLRTAVFFFLLAYGLPALANPFAILAAGLYVQNGAFVYFFFITGLLLVALLARRLGWSVEYNRQKSQQLDRLEKLGRAILNASPDASTLPEILTEHVPGMFTALRGLICVHPEQVLLKFPSDWLPDTQAIWQWLSSQREARAFTPREILPWNAHAELHNPLAIAPVLDVETGQSIGGIYIELQTLAVPWSHKMILTLIPALQSLSAQVASALYQAKVYAQALAHHRTQQQLALARRIQSSFLPAKVPQIPGWQLYAALEPARDIAGDFYDFIPLQSGKFGILIADVADKGVGSALYMALSRTLIRTYAAQYDHRPDQVLAAANTRILQDARANLFVTVFYGVLDPATGKFTYCNAGHNPPMIFRHRDENEIQTLGNTGMPLGIEEQTEWYTAEVLLERGDVLLLYTDGMTDAQNERGEFIERDQLFEVARNNLGLPAEAMGETILSAVYRFAGEAPQFDDITLMIVIRDLFTPAVDGDNTPS